MAQVPATQRSQGGRLAPRRENTPERMRRDFNSLFDRLWNGWLVPFDQDLEPVRLWDFDVTENDKEIVVRAEIPGFEPNELDVQINNDVLTIRAEKEQRDDRREEYRSFFRSVTLPSGIDAEHVQATYRNGVLELHIPRAEGAGPKRINVQAQQGGGQQAQQISSGRGGNQGQQSQASQGQQTGSQAGTTASERAKK
jgi:HSP20 family protein